MFFVLGIIRYQLSLPKIDQSNVLFYHNQEIKLVGKIIAEPSYKNNSSSIVVDTLLINTKKVRGLVLVNVPLYANYQYGQILTVDCKLMAPKSFSDFNYKNYLAKNNIFSICQNSTNFSVLLNQGGNVFLGPILVFKQQAQKLINKYFPEPHGSLFSALLLGNRGSMPQDFKNWLSQTGTSHVVAISGLHIVILTTLLETILFS